MDDNYSSAERRRSSRAIRQYKKSSVPRLRWTAELHRSFVEAVRCLGGKHQATPKKIMQMMAVTGLNISHIKSHLQMYRSMRESSTSDELIAINNYPQKTPNLLLRRKCPDQFRETVPYHGKLIRVVPLHCQLSRRRIIRMDTNVVYHEYQLQGTEGSSTNRITKGSTDVPRVDMELHKISELNFLSLGNHQTSEPTALSPINLDLTISTH